MPLMEFEYRDFYNQLSLAHCTLFIPRAPIFFAVDNKLYAVRRLHISTTPDCPEIVGEIAII